MGKISCKEVERTLETVRGLDTRIFVMGGRLNLWPLRGAHHVDREPDLVMRKSTVIYAVKIWTARFWLHIETSPHFIATTLTC
jgi:hypothetical protein